MSKEMYSFRPRKFYCNDPSKDKGSIWENWEPHARMTPKTFGWWYMTAYVHDAEGNPYFLFTGNSDHMGEDMKERMIGEKVNDDNRRVIGHTNTITDYNAGRVITVMRLPDQSLEQMYDPKNNRLNITDNKDVSLVWDFVGDMMNMKYTCPESKWDFVLTNASDAVWHKDKHGFDGMIQQGAEDDWSFYYCLPNCQLSGTLMIKNEDGSEKTVQVSGRAWVDRQWGDFASVHWEWASYRFNNGAAMHLYSFAGGHQEGLYRDAEGKVQYFDNVTVRQNGYAKSEICKAWTSWGWTYEFPIEIEGSKQFTVRPKSNKEFLEFPSMTSESFGEKIKGFVLFEGAGELVNDTTGEVVGISINESGDIRAMKNGPYDKFQK